MARYFVGFGWVRRHWALRRTWAAWLRAISWSILGSWRTETEIREGRSSGIVATSARVVTMRWRATCWGSVASARAGHDFGTPTTPEGGDTGVEARSGDSRGSGRGFAPMWASWRRSLAARTACS